MADFVDARNTRFAGAQLPIFMKKRTFTGHSFLGGAQFVSTNNRQNGEKGLNRAPTTPIEEPSIKHEALCIFAMVAQQVLSVHSYPENRPFLAINIIIISFGTVHHPDWKE